MPEAICMPRSPANLRAYGSRKTASARSLSCARYTATHRAVSEMWRIGFAELMAGESYLFAGDEACANRQLLTTVHYTTFPESILVQKSCGFRAAEAASSALRSKACGSG